MRKRQFWTDCHEEYYLKEVVEKSLTVLRFTIAAAVGEVRHFAGHARAGGGTSYWTPDYAKRYKKAKQYMTLLLGGMGYKQRPSGRSIVYRAYVDESNWLRYLVAARYLFGSVRWGSSFGGQKWAKGCEHAIRLYRSLCGGTFSDIAICFDTLINHFHNGGLLLNKFDCSQVMSLTSLLDEKQKGEFERIDEMLDIVPCSSWKRGGCNALVRCKPLQNGGNNGKKKVQREFFLEDDVLSTQEEEYEEMEEKCGDPYCQICYPEEEG
jgi:hypothetical protein